MVALLVVISNRQKLKAEFVVSHLSFYIIIQLRRE